MANHKTLPDLDPFDVLCALMDKYQVNPEKGTFYSRALGRNIGHPIPDGYVRLRILDRAYLAHRLMWLYVHMEWPKNEIDHINRVKHDNRIVNLRDVTRLENMQNVGERGESHSVVMKEIWRQRKQRKQDGIQSHNS